MGIIFDSSVFLGPTQVSFISSLINGINDDCLTDHEHQNRILKQILKVDPAQQKKITGVIFVSRQIVDQKNLIVDDSKDHKQAHFISFVLSVDTG